MKIYTKTGDKGETGLLGGKRVLKSDVVVEALGSIDELNAFLGTMDFPLEHIQEDLQIISSEIAGHKSLKSVKAEKLEKEIDRMQKELPELRNFILPKGQIHLARAICRRAERRVVDSGRGQNDALKYLNRLSDYLFVLARYENFKNGIKETIWNTTH